MNIIVIEQNLSIRKIIHRKLELTKIRLNIMLATNLNQGLIKLSKSKFDVIFISKNLFNIANQKQLEDFKNNIVVITLTKESLKKKFIQLYLDAKVDQYKKIMFEAVKQKPKIRPLSKREKEILFLISHGLNTQKISSNLKIKETTIKTHLRRIRIKLHTANRTHSVAKAMRQGLIL
jgi:ATP/maltotriose-dependent transcriptional regulator MalT